MSLKRWIIERGKASCSEPEKTLNINPASLTMYTIIHFLVDLTCIYRLYAMVMPQSGSLQGWLQLVVLYNFLAFALPGLVGLIADLTDTSDSMAALGCFMTAIPVFLSGSVLLMVCLQGVGNGLFHVGAGRKVLLESKGGYTPSGIFICSGALGVFFGTVWRKSFLAPVLWGLAVLLFLSGLILLLRCLLDKKTRSNETGMKQAKESSIVNSVSGDYEEVSENRNKKSAGFLSLSAVMILLVVVLRSFLGTVLAYEWKDTFLISFLFVLSVVAGKALGGIVADRLGVQFASVLSLGGAALAVLFSEHNPFLGCLSILLFNMTMPLTLGLLAKRWKYYPGFAFGMLMLALFIGTLPDLASEGMQLSVQQFCAGSLVSLLFLLLGIGRNKRRVRKE